MYADLIEDIEIAENELIECQTSDYTGAFFMMVGSVGFQFRHYCWYSPAVRKVYEVYEREFLADCGKRRLSTSELSKWQTLLSCLRVCTMAYRDEHESNYRSGYAQVWPGALYC